MNGIESLHNEEVGKQKKLLLKILSGTSAVSYTHLTLPTTPYV